MSLDYPAEFLQIVVVSDGSSDQTEDILREQAHHPRVSVVLKQLAGAKASGLNDALELAQGEIIVFTDARQLLRPDSLRLLMENFADPKWDARAEIDAGRSKIGDSARGLGLYWSIEKQIREWEALQGRWWGDRRILCGAQELVGADSDGNHLGRCLCPAPDCAQRVAGGIRWTRQSVGQCGPGPRT